MWPTARRTASGCWSDEHDGEDGEDGEDDQDNDEDRTTDLAAIRTQLRGTHRVDQRDDVTRSPSVAIQDLYDSGRGMGRR